MTPQVYVPGDVVFILCVLGALVLLLSGVVGLLALAVVARRERAARSDERAALAPGRVRRGPRLARGSVPPLSPDQLARLPLGVLGRPIAPAPASDTRAARGCPTEERDAR